MTLKRKRPSTATSRRKRRIGSPTPRPQPQETEEKIVNSFFNRKCKLSTLLTANYGDYKNLFRQVAEEFSIARRDSMNFTLFMVVQWFNSQRVELQAFQRQQIPLVQTELQKVLHETLLTTQLQHLLQQIRDSLQQENVIPEQYEDLLRIQAQLGNAFGEILPISEQLDDLLLGFNNGNNHQGNQLEYAQQLQVDNDLTIRLHLVLVDLSQQFPQFKALVYEGTNTAENLHNTIEERLTGLLNRVPQNEQVILQGARNRRDLENKIVILRQRQTTLYRSQPLEQSDALHLQTIRQMQFTIINSEAAVQRMREQEQQQQNYLNQSVIAQEYIANLPVLFQAADIVEKFRNLTRIIENTWQQIVLALKDPEYNFEFPSITSETFWSHVYRKVCADPGNFNERMTLNRSIVAHFEDFDVSRKRPGNGDYEYCLPILDIIHREISRTYASTTIIQNITMHLLSINLWIIRLFKGFLIFHQNQNNVQVAVMTIAKKAAYKIINHQQFQDLPNEQEIPGLETLYNRIRLIYDADFLETEPDDLSNYENAKMHLMKYLRVSYRLLQEASIQINWQVKPWSLLPIPSHSIVHFPINNGLIMYGLFVKAQAQNLRIPAFLISEYDRRLINPTAFKDLYSGPNDRQRIWEEIFNIDQLEKNRLRDLQETDGHLDINDPHQRTKLGFSLKTDGHMASVMFERVSRGLLASNMKEMRLQQRNIDLTNKSKGLYPLYKNPTGITEQDRIVGIDPGVRDIICSVDCNPEEMINKRTTKQHSLSISNASYKLRSGMQWINQRELNNRVKERMQDTYDIIRSPKVFSNYQLMVYLQSISQTHNRVFNFMRSFKHRENKGYNYSNRKRTEDFVARVVIGTTNKEEPYKLCHTSTSSLQRKIRRNYRRTIIQRYSQNPLPLYPSRIRNLAVDPRRTVVAYGDASIKNTYKGNTPIPVKAIQRAIATKAVVIPVDEFRTSVTCSHCLTRLENVPDEDRMVCRHKKKLHRSNGIDGHPAERKTVMKCFDDENHVLHRTSVCPDRIIARQRRDIYPIKRYNRCQSTNNAGQLYWNRDVNAASNIRHVLSAYVANDFNLESRPVQLARGRRDEDEDENEEQQQQP